MNTVWASIRKNILIGLLLVTPLAVTLFLIRFLYNIVHGPLSTLLPEAMRHPVMQPLLVLAAIGLGMLCLFLLGFFFRNVAGRRFYRFADRAVSRLPLINKIYVSTRDLTAALFTQRQTLFRSAVLMEYPRRGIYSMAFVTANVPASFRRRAQAELPGDELVTLFVPTTPNPTSGVLIVAPRSELVELDITVSEAMKLVISGGAVFPGDEAEQKGATLIDLLDTWAHARGLKKDGGTS
ncbi:DUF502 domain-containing protein [Kiritimatiella glycovorans]|uniref:DUF502 domain-containing protein n=1 Tax=Kiritimatiella glycovorans TaxID=1307763 RepID=A0A0G3EHX4_9BACT|nr:DUF502 domain-containing protein [Kiritimatiella glycovorans]AKJ65027.1 hypothetical protein L21SP4_01790 [Kiritimatiella glycovorans]